VKGTERNDRWMIAIVTENVFAVPHPAGLTLDVALDIYSPFQCWHSGPRGRDQYCRNCEVRS
jgi:hypothetical protein